jgi:hypothetical protein
MIALQHLWNAIMGTKSEPYVIMHNIPKERATRTPVGPLETLRDDVRRAQEEYQAKLEFCREAILTHTANAVRYHYAHEAGPYVWTYDKHSAHRAVGSMQQKSVHFTFAEWKNLVAFLEKEFSQSGFKFERIMDGHASESNYTMLVFHIYSST